MFSELRILSDTDCERCAISIELARAFHYFSFEPPYVYSSKSTSLTDEVDVRPLMFLEGRFSSGSSGIEFCLPISCAELLVS
jgi:hypothetical protein